MHACHVHTCISAKLPGIRYALSSEDHHKLFLMSADSILSGGCLDPLQTPLGRDVSPGHFQLLHLIETRGHSRFVSELGFSWTSRCFLMAASGSDTNSVCVNTPLVCLDLSFIQSGLLHMLSQQTELCLQILGTELFPEWSGVSQAESQLSFVTTDVTLLLPGRAETDRNKAKVSRQ